MGKFQINSTEAGFNFHLKAKNGETIAVSQTYSKLESCKRGIDSVVKNAHESATEDQTIRGFIKRKNPKFEIYKNDSGAFYFRLKARNGDVLLTSESYTAKASAQNGIRSVQKNSLNSIVIEP